MVSKNDRKVIQNFVRLATDPESYFLETKKQSDIFFSLALMLVMAVIYRYFNNDDKVWLSLIVMFVSGLCFSLGVIIRSNHSGLKIVGNYINADALENELDDEKI